MEAECVLLSCVPLWLEPCGEVIGSDPSKKKKNKVGRNREQKNLRWSCLSWASRSRKWQKTSKKRRKERGIHNMAIISSSDNWPCYMKEISIQINMASPELYHREVHLKELTSHRHTHTLKYAPLVLLLSHHPSPSFTYYIPGFSSFTLCLPLYICSCLSLRLIPFLIFFFASFSTSRFHFLMACLWHPFPLALGAGLTAPPPGKLEEGGFVW